MDSTCEQDVFNAFLEAYSTDGELPTPANRDYLTLREKGDGGDEAAAVYEIALHLQIDAARDAANAALRTAVLAVKRGAADVYKDPESHDYWLIVTGGGGRRFTVKGTTYTAVDPNSKVAKNLGF